MLICPSYCRGGKICLTDHFKPLWARNVPKFGIAHAMALGVSNIIIISNYRRSGNFMLGNFRMINFCVEKFL